MAVSACPRILYARKLTYGLYFVALHSSANHSLRVGFPEGPFSKLVRPAPSSKGI
jgi:hypothetical protein